jgi:hypothetical protein
MLDENASVRPAARSKAQNDLPWTDFSLIRTSWMNHPESNLSTCHLLPSAAIIGRRPGRDWLCVVTGDHLTQPRIMTNAACRHG